MSAQCKCPLASFSPHREERCAFFRKKKSGPQKAEEAAPGEAIPPASENQKVPPTAQSEEVPPTAEDPKTPNVAPGQDAPSSKDQKDLPIPTQDQHIQPTISTERNTGESSEAAKERLEKLVADAIQGANLPPGTSINVTINVNTPEPQPSIASSGWMDSIEPVIAEAFNEADVTIDPKSPVGEGFSVVTPKSPDDHTEGLDFVRSESDDAGYNQNCNHLSISPVLSAPLPAPLSTLPGHFGTTGAVPSSILSLVPPSPPTSTMAHVFNIVRSPLSPVVPAWPAEIEDMVSGFTFGDEPNLNPEDDTDNEEQAL